MKNLIYILNVLMILIFASCKDENAFMPGDDDNQPCYSILVSAPNNATRAVYEESGENIAVKWEKGDVIILSLKINSEKKEYSFVYKKDTLDGAGKFVHYGEIPNATRIYGTVSFGSDPGAYEQVQKKNNKCKEWLIKNISAFDLTKHEVISLLPSNVRSLIHIQLLSPALFPGKSVLEIKGLKNTYTITLGENPDYVFADKGEILDIYVTIPADQKSIEKGTTLKFYFYAYDNLAGSDMTVKKRQKNGDEYHYYMKCNETIALNNDKVVKMPLPNRPTHTAIQLGLKVKWATMNVGATNEEEPGEYYAWGYVEPAPDRDYSEANCSRTWKKNFDQLKTDKIINGNNLTPEFDAATQNWGENWRMPTQKEIDELIKGCDWGVISEKGYTVKSKKYPSKSIRIPLTGSYENKTFMDGKTYPGVGEISDFGRIFFWSSTAYSGTDHAYSFDSIHKNGDKYDESPWVPNRFRWTGRTVRAVIAK